MMQIKRSFTIDGEEVECTFRGTPENLKTFMEIVKMCKDHDFQLGLPSAVGAAETVGFDVVSRVGVRYLGDHAYEICKAIGS